MALQRSLPPWLWSPVCGSMEVALRHSAQRLPLPGPRSSTAGCLQAVANHHYTVNVGLPRARSLQTPDGSQWKPFCFPNALGLPS